MSITARSTILINKKGDQKVIRFSPSQILVLGFAAVIFAGALLLSLPIATVAGEQTTFLDALFTSTSAVCVTGLVVVDTGTHYTPFGQVVIMLLIQVGGLGFMTMATLFSLIMGKRINLRERLIIQEAMNQLSMEGMVRLIRNVLLLTFVIEGAAALILSIRFSFDYGIAKGIYFGIFHAVSAFNNAGFDLFGEYRSITGYASDFTVNLVISTLIILGGIGFTVILDIYRKRNWKRLYLHSKLVLVTSAILIVFGTIVIYLLEYNNPATLGELGMKGKILASYFQSVTPRTAGFNSLNIGGLRSATQFLIILLMFIGASPGSTGGGIKTSTFGAMVTAVWAMIKGKEDVELFKRRLPKEIIYRSLTITFVALALVIAVTMILSITEKATFLQVMFETTSAFGTVGLSTGITPNLTKLGRVFIILTMFAGRLGPLTLAFALAQKQQKAHFRLPEEKIMVG